MGAWSNQTILLTVLSFSDIELTLSLDVALLFQWTVKWSRLLLALLVACNSTVALRNI
jgi:hypothetical protein